MRNYQYQIGGSLRNDAPCYVERQADSQLYEALQRGEFCYVLNSRQMGKSSLLVRTMYRLEAVGYRCSAVDITGIGSENITPQQWYKGILAELWQGFSLYRQQRFRQWWATDTETSVVQRLGAFVSEVLLDQFPEGRFVIFIDEIDSILSLPFSIDDFFAFIRFCYNQRAIDPNYRRLTFAVFGVATPSDLIQDRQRTPFNIGTAIELQGFTLDEVQPLVGGFSCPEDRVRGILTAILSWTGGQPFLTQKLCQLVLDSQETASIAPGREANWIDRIVREQLLKNWEFQDEPEHLRTIRARLQYNPEKAARLLGIYLQILQGHAVTLDDSQEQAELLLSGLIVKQGGELQVKNRIYAAVFDRPWVEAQLDLLRPYSQTLEAWVASDRSDRSRLLRGQALQDARFWARGKSLSDLDYQYLAASEALDRREMQQELEAERTAAVAAQLDEERRRRSQEVKNIQLQRYLLGALSTILLVILGLGTQTFLLYRRAVLNEINALAVSSLATSADDRFNSRSQLDALVRAIRAKRLLQQVVGGTRTATLEPVEASLQQATYSIAEANRLSGHGDVVETVAFSPDGQTIASAGADASIRVWEHDGTVRAVLTGHRGTVRALAFSADGQWLASAGDEAEIFLWPATDFSNWSQNQPERRIQTDLTAISSLAFHPVKVSTLAVTGTGSNAVHAWNIETGMKTASLEHETGDRSGGAQANSRVRYSPDGRLLAAMSPTGMVTIWQDDTPYLLPESSRARDIAFAPSNDLLAVVRHDGTIALWQRLHNDDSWQVSTTLNARCERGCRHVTFSADGRWLAATGDKGDIQLWQPSAQGWMQPLPSRHLLGHGDRIAALTFSPDGTLLASASHDRTVRLWRPDNLLRRDLAGLAPIVSAAFTGNGDEWISVGRDRVVRQWQEDGQFLPLFESAAPGLQRVVVAAGRQPIAVVRTDRGVELWDANGQQQATLSQDASVSALAFRNDGRVLATGGSEPHVQLWRSDGEALESWRGHTGAILGLAYSPTDDLLASASADKTINLWDRNGQIQATLYGHRAPVTAVAFAPQGETIVSASGDRTLKLWNRDGELLRNLIGHQDAVLAVTIGGPTGNIIASGSRDRTVRLWQRDRPNALPFVLNGHRAAVQSVAISPNGRLLLSTSEDGRALIWNLEAILTGDTLTYACEWARDYLLTNPELDAENRQLCASVLARRDRARATAATPEPQQ